MIVGVPKEIKRDEYRVAMLPVGVEELTRAGHRVLVAARRRAGIGLADQLYDEPGRSWSTGPEEVFGQADLIIKVKEPLPEELPLLRRGQTCSPIFTSPPIGN